MATRTIWITQNRLIWTMDDPSYLKSELTGNDDRILKFVINCSGNTFLVITRNGKAWQVFGSEDESGAFLVSEFERYAKPYQAQESGNYAVNNPGYCYDSRYDAEEDGCYNTIYLGRGEIFLDRGNRIVFHDYDETVVMQWIMQQIDVQRIECKIE